MVRAGSSPVLIGRTAELAQLEARYDAAASGVSAGSVLVLGEAGVGKSRLVAELVNRVRARGGRALVGGAMEIDEANLPYVPVLEALRPLVEESLDGDAAADEAIGRARHDLARLFPELGPGAAGDEVDLGLAQSRLFGQLLGLLGRAGQDRPVLLVLEDLQWSDRSTRELVAFLGRTLHSARVLLVVTVRTDALHARHPLTPLLAELGRVERVSQIRLERFTRAEHDAQVTAILGTRPPNEFLAQTYARSDGNPFYTEELIAPGSGSVSMSSGLRDMLLARARGLSDRTRRLLRVVAVGWSVTHPLLEAVAGLAPDELLESLREAVDRAIITTDPASARYRFRHPLIAEAVYEDLLPGERIRWHAAYARALEAAPRLGDSSPSRAAAELANHWMRAGEERRALPALVAAARSAHAAFAQAEAFAALDKALAILEVTPEALDDIDIGLLDLTRLAAEAAQASGEFARAVELWERAVALTDATADPVGAGLLHARAGEAYWLIGDGESFTRHRRRAVDLVPAEPPSAARSWVLSRLASALVMAPASDEPRPLAEEAVSVARAVGADIEEGRALGVLGVAQLRAGDAAAAVESLRAALAISGRRGRLDEEAIDRSNLSEALHEAGDLREALRVVVEGVERVHAAGLHHTYGETTNAIAIDRAFLAGEWALAERLLGEGRARAPRGLPETWLALVAAEFEAARGNHAAAQVALEAVDRLATSPRIVGWTGPHEQRAHAALWAGRPAEALDHTRDALATLDASALAPSAAEWRWLTIHGLRAIGDLRERTPASERAALDGEADALLERFTRHDAAVTAGHPASAHLLADRVQVRAEYARASGHDDPALWAAAAVAWAALDHRFDEAVARWREGSAALAMGGASVAPARDALKAAHRLACEMGARPLIEAVEGLATRGRITLDQLDGTPPDDPIPEALGVLTAREREVLALLAAGRTNSQIAERLFISPKTASVHVTNIKDKLGVESRVEAATLATRLALPVDGDGESKEPDAEI
jgi:DNA-binding CsgD family transcriptional regulator/tetratricopeptide (TPR) repeat protein